MLPQDIEVLLPPKPVQNAKGKAAHTAPESGDPLPEDLPNVFEGEGKHLSIRGDDFEIQVKCSDVTLVVHT